MPNGFIGQNLQEKGLKHIKRTSESTFKKYSWYKISA